MIKLYKNKFDRTKLYWEAWDNRDGNFTVHWGNLSDKGESEIIKPSLFKTALKKVEEKIKTKRSEGFKECDPESEYTLLIEYAVDGFGNESDLDKRYALQERMDETLGWTALGHCDGGSIGSGTMEVCCFVVDFDLAKKVIEEDLVDTEFANYTRIYDENA